MSKLTNTIFILFGMIIAFIIACESNTKSESEVYGSVESFSDCKYLNKATGLSKIVETLPDTVAGIEYDYDGKSTLTMTHINAGFNCCPGEIFIEIIEEDNLVLIEEFELEALCDCNCLYDIVIVVEDIEPGNYSFMFVEPYLHIDNKEIAFILGLNEECSGLITFDRKGYPWGN